MSLNNKFYSKTLSQSFTDWKPPKNTILWLAGVFIIILLPKLDPWGVKVTTVSIFNFDRIKQILINIFSYLAVPFPEIDRFEEIMRGEDIIFNDSNTYDEDEQIDIEMIY